MKKSLLLSTALLAAGAAYAAVPAGNSDVTRCPVKAEVPAVAQMETRASGSLDFGYAQNPYTAYSLKDMVAGKSRVHMLVKLRAEDAKTFAGNKITGIKFYNGTDGNQNSQSNPISEAEVCIVEDLTKAPVVSQTVKLSKTAWELNNITLDTPYEIKGDAPVYFGYTITVPQGTAFYMVVDGIADNEDNLIYGTTEGDGIPDKFSPAGAEIGSLCCSLVISGDNLPANLVTISGAAFPNYVKTGETGNYTLAIRNGGVNPVSSIEVETKVGNAEPEVKAYNFKNALASSQAGTIQVEGITFPETGFQTVAVRVTKVNGEANEATGSYEGSVAVYSEGFDRNLVLEEGTGAWCGWCVAGIVMCEYINENYGDRFFPIACHNGDRMDCADYQSFIGAMFTGFPGSWTNRVVEHSPGTTSGPGVNETFVNEVFKQFTSYPAYCNVSIESMHIDNAAKTVTVKTNTEFALDCDQAHALNFVLIENHVGPYAQTNYYAGGARGEMAGWERKGSSVNTYYDDVARAYNTYGGVANSIPASVKAGEKYEFSNTISMKSCTGDEMEKRAVIVFITNTKTGEIVNAAKSVVKEGGVENIAVEEMGEARYYNLQGVEVKNPENGIFIRVQNGKSQKVAL